MTVTLRQRRTAYDNISSGNAAGKERTVRGDAGVTELYGGGYGTGSTDSVGRNNITPGTTDQGPDNQAGATDPTDERTGSSNVAGFATNA